ncbi:MAG: ABC transporter permease [Acidobacteria bacterium]|nr:ABC transporter permease [Acidobacteriota bacterium]
MKNPGVALKETIFLALDTLRVQKLRSFLTLLGVILAVTTLVSVISIVEGMNHYVATKIANLGSNVFVVNQMGIITSFEEFLKARKRPPLSYEDYEAVVENLEVAKQVAGGFSNRVNVRYANETLEDVSLIGATQNFAEVRGINVGRGRFLTGTDDEHRSPVCFVGMDIVNRFFANTEALGKTIRVGAKTYEIVGIAETMGTILGQSRDGFVFIPLGTYRKDWARPRDSMFFLVQATHPELMDDAYDEVRVLIRARRHLAYKDDDNFGVVMPTAITSLFQSLTGNIFAVAIGLTSVFLIVGGIVIMNIMLASVVERTREIGIRKSLGARRRHIIMQFLIEATVLSCVGGLVGIIAAGLIGALLTAVTPMPIYIPLRAVLIALAMSTGVGMFFGIYPAVRASRLDPIEALRFEV